MSEADAIEALNELVMISKDGQKRFLEAERLVRDPDLKMVLHRFSDDCADATRDLEACIVAAGGYPDNMGSAAGAIHRELMNVKARIMPNEERAVLQECETGEEHTREVFEAIMKIELPPAVRTLVERQYLEVLNHHRFIRSLRERYAQTTNPH